MREELGLPPRSPRAIAAGSTTSWQRGGISPFQYERGRELTASEGRAYESFGAEPA